MVIALMTNYVVRKCTGGSTQPASFLVGPEGGFSPREMALLDELGSTSSGSPSAGIQLVSLGPTVLRAETAAIAALSGFVCWREGN